MDGFLYIVSGIGVTLQYAILSLTFGSCIALLLVAARMGQGRAAIFATLAKIYVSIFRGTPLLLQLSFAYFAIPSLTGYQITAFEAGLATFSLNSAAYLSEIFRAGIASVDKGQFEAARAMGLPYRLMMKDIILPQAIRKVLPAIVNESVDLVKESAILSVIGEADIMRRAQVVAAEQYTFFGPLLMAAACYYVLVQLLSFAAKKLEQKLTYDHA